MTNPIHSSVTPEPNPTADTDAILERIERCLKDVSLGFERWDEHHAHGPGLYVVVTRDSTGGLATPMGSNRWPVEECASVFDGTAAFLGTAQQVALSCDGAIVVHRDGTIDETMVRITQLPPAERQRLEDLPYAGWMGARHMSALETSTREEVVAAITLSEEDGRVTVFVDGTFEDSPAISPVRE